MRLKHLVEALVVCGGALLLVVAFVLVQAVPRSDARAGGGKIELFDGTVFETDDPVEFDRILEENREQVEFFSRTTRRVPELDFDLTPFFGVLMIVVYLPALGWLAIVERARLPDWLRGSSRSWLWGLGGGLALPLLSALWTAPLLYFEVELPDMTQMVDGSNLLPFAVAAILLAPIVEELYIRGRVFEWVQKRIHTLAAFLISSAIFALMHGLPIFLPVYFVYGLVLAWLRVRTGSLLAPIVAHALNNTAAVVSLALV